jgi:hypothetical protein
MGVLRGGGRVIGTMETGGVAVTVVGSTCVTGGGGGGVVAFTGGFGGGGFTGAGVWVGVGVGVARRSERGSITQRGQVLPGTVVFSVVVARRSISF